MKNIVKYMIACVIVVALAISVSTLSQAKGKSDKSKGKGNQKSEWKTEKNEKKTKTSGTPYGWSRGRKTGWRGGSYPPGWSKWDKSKQEEWSKDRVTSLQRIDYYLVRYEFPEKQSEHIVSAFDKAIADGMAINEASKRIVNGLKDGDTRRNLMIDAAQKSLDLLR